MSSSRRIFTTELLHDRCKLCIFHKVSWLGRPGHEGFCFLQISQLVEEVQRLQASITKLQETSSGQIARLEEQLDHKRQHIARLEARLDAQRDYDDVKRELRSVRTRRRRFGILPRVSSQKQTYKQTNETSVSTCNELFDSLITFLWYTATLYGRF